MNNSATGQYFVVEFCLFNKNLRNLITSLYLHLHLDFICTDFCKLVKEKFLKVVEQLNVKSTNPKNFKAEVNTSVLSIQFCKMFNL